MFAQNKRFVEKHTRENKGEGEREREREREGEREQRRNTLDERVALGAILRRKDQRGRRNSKWTSERILCTLFWCTGSADGRLQGLIISLESSRRGGRTVTQLTSASPEKLEYAPQRVRRQKN